MKVVCHTCSANVLVRKDGKLSRHWAREPMKNGSLLPIGRCSGSLTPHAPDLAYCEHCHRETVTIDNVCLWCGHPKTAKPVMLAVRLLLMNKDDILKNVEQWGDALHVDIWYPRVEGNPIKAVQVGLMDVRAADDIRIEYDFERDGWAVSQAQVFEWDADDEVCDPQWKEVAFIKAWASEKKPNNASTRTSGDAPASEEISPL